MCFLQNVRSVFGFTRAVRTLSLRSQNCVRLDVVPSLTPSRSGGWERSCLVLAPWRPWPDYCRWSRALAPYGHHPWISPHSSTSFSSWDVETCGQRWVPQGPAPRALKPCVSPNSTLLAGFFCFFCVFQRWGLDPRANHSQIHGPGDPFSGGRLHSLLVMALSCLIVIWIKIIQKSILILYISRNYNIALFGQIYGLKTALYNRMFI